MRCLRTSTRVSPGVNWWIGNTEPLSAWHFQQLTANTAELKAEAECIFATTSDGPEKLDKLERLIERAKSLDIEITTCLEQLPESFRGSTVAWQGSVRQHNAAAQSQFRAFPGAIDVYPDLWVANLWNVMRSMRLVLTGIVVRCVAIIVSPRDYRTTVQYNEAITLRTELINSVISSVPYHYGLVGRRTGLHQCTATTSFECGDNSSTKGLAGYFLLYPLARIVNEDCISENLRQWVRDQLTYIGDRLGIRYAKAITLVCDCILPYLSEDCTFLQSNRQIYESHR